MEGSLLLRLSPVHGYVKDILTLESVAFQHSVRASLSVGQIPTRARQCKGLVEGSRGAKAGL